MQDFIAMPLVTLYPILLGSKEVKFCHTPRCLPLQIFHGVNLAVMSAWLGMALGKTAASPVQLMYTVSHRS